MTPILLASTSPYKKLLFERLNLPFQGQKPLFDEELHKTDNLEALQLCKFLAIEKARSLSLESNCVIAGDQIAVLNGEILGKPHTKDKAVEQLSKMQNQTHQLLTAVCLFFKGKPISFCNVTQLQMRPLRLQEIEYYISVDQPLDCAGSYKIEKMGISLFEKIETDDFTAIQGLPLLELSKQLRKLGYKI